MPDEFYETQTSLLASLLRFTQTFFKIRTNQPFEISHPLSQESHFVTIMKELTKVMLGETQNLIINVPPRYGKTEILICFMAWCYARFGDCNFIYTSYSKTLAARQTKTLRDMMQLPEFKRMFDVAVKQDSSAKDDFETTENGHVYAAGAGGTITGLGAGIKNCNRFSGALIMDDMHKPDEATSDVIRQGVIDWYHNTLKSRKNNANTPIIFICQRVHEEDLAGHLIATGDFKVVSLAALNQNNQALYPEMHSVEYLLKMKHDQPYVFAAQMQQNPIPAGGGLFRRDDFITHDKDPKILATFITADTAETDKTYNDATVFSFWGLYKLETFGQDLDEYGLIWLDCLEIRVEPRDLENEFKSFYFRCMAHPVKPRFAAIEKKSTGTTLLSILKGIPGISTLEIDRNRSSGSKAQRFIDAQQYISQKRISFLYGARHMERCVTHMVKITANDSHAHDDIADTCADAIKIGIVDKIIQPLLLKDDGQSDKVVTLLNRNIQKKNQLYANRKW